MKSLLFAMPGTPVLYYGDEIGMGDNIYLGDRDGVRTPMQWSSDRNAGFSQANSQRLYLPVTIDPEYHYESINVEAQQNNPHSLLWWMKRLIALRKRYRAFEPGGIEFLLPGEYQGPGLFALSSGRMHAGGEQSFPVCAVCGTGSAPAIRAWCPRRSSPRLAFPPIGEHALFAHLGAPLHLLVLPGRTAPRGNPAHSPGSPDPHFFFNRPGGGAFPGQKPAASGGIIPALSHQMPLVRRQGPEYQGRHHNRSDSLPLRRLGGLFHSGQSGLCGRGAGNLCPAPGVSLWGKGFPGPGGIFPVRGGPPPGSGPGGPAL